MRTRRVVNGDGVDYVRCHICGARRHVISGRHLSKHELDRETYMAEYRLSPDQLIAKDSHQIHSSRRDYYSYDKRDWIRATKKIYKKTAIFMPVIFKRSAGMSITKVCGFMVSGTVPFARPGSIPKLCANIIFGIRKRSLRAYPVCELGTFRAIPSM